jgi:hypothetical protein
MLDQPPPQPTSAIRAPGRLSASCTDGTPDSAPGSRSSYQGRFMSAWDSRASGPSCSQPTPPPFRYASSRAGICIAAEANIRAMGAR